MSTAITAADINNLRKATGAGMLDCRKALQESNGDFDAAIDWLRKQGQKVAAKRMDREAKEGVIIAQTNADHSKGWIVSVSCETDFVSKNEDFVKFAQTIADAAVANNVANAEELSKVSVDGQTIADMINDKLASIGEKIAITHVDIIEAPYVASYIHGAYRIGVLVGMSAASEEVGKDLAMQIAALSPIAVSEESVSAETIEHERGLIIDTMKEDPKMAGKPDEMLHKIAEGKLKAFFKENTLMAQPFVKDAGTTVADYVKSVNKDLVITAFKRVALG